MKSGLQRIEATLNNLNSSGTAAAEGNSPKRTYSFTISSSNQEHTAATQSQPEADHTSPEADATLPRKLSVQTFSVKESGHKSLSLPKFKSLSFTSHNNVSNPALALNLLQEIQTQVGNWQTELQQILRQIQDIYLDGPIVDGWLESHNRKPESDGAATFRHAEVDRLMDYVEEICNSDDNVSCQSPRTGYRLCGLDESGKMWSRPCPPDQLPSISVAIARYHKLRQLLGRKEHLENRLHQLAETLIVLHSHMQ